MTAPKLRPDTPVDFQVYSELLKTWFTITHHTLAEIPMVERRRRNYPPSQFKTRWVLPSYRKGKLTVRPLDPEQVAA